MAAERVAAAAVTGEGEDGDDDGQGGTGEGTRAGAGRSLALFIQHHAPCGHPICVCMMKHEIFISLRL